MRLSFHGGAREVTGACYLLETKRKKILIDCGFFQGCDECGDQNFSDFKFQPDKIDLLLVTHAHLDHIGRIPKLVKDGFKGKIFSTAPTRDLARLILEDAYSLSQRFKKELYNQKDLEKTFLLWEAVQYHEILEFEGVKIKFNQAGHILGSSLIELWIEGKHVLFSGDIGNTPSSLLPLPDTFKDLDFLVIESTYGSRIHESEDERIINLERAVEDAASRLGTLMIPAFATERTQDILFLLNQMVLFKRIPEIPVFVDAPLAIRVTSVFESYQDYYKEEIRKLFHEHPSLFRFKKLKFTESVEESKAINNISPPKVILAGSGMMNGGRILHHARRYLGDPNSILLIIGYQTAGSLGRRLLDGEKFVKIFEDEVEIKAEIRQISGFSAHADNPQLYSFVDSTRDTLKEVFIVQGEEAEALHFAQEIKDRMGIKATAPMPYEETEL